MKTFKQFREDNQYVSEGIGALVTPALKLGGKALAAYSDLFPIYTLEKSLKLYFILFANFFCSLFYIKHHIFNRKIAI